MEEAIDKENWGTTTFAGIFAGLLYGAVKEAWATSEGSHTLLPLLQARTDDHREKRRLWRGAMEQRLLRITKGSLEGGLRLGLFAAVFAGVEEALAVRRGSYDTLNVVAAAAASTGVFGLASRGPPKSRVQAAALGMVLGAVICLPLGYVRTRLRDRYLEELKAEELRGSSTPSQDGVERVINRLESITSIEDKDLQKRNMKLDS